MRLTEATPVLDVADLAAAVDFFVGRLGFKVGAREPKYAYVSRDAAAFRLFEAPGNGPLRPGDCRYGSYVCVDDVDALYAEFSPRLPDLAAPITKIYGMREIAVLAPDGDLIVFGQRID